MQAFLDTQNRGIFGYDDTTRSINLFTDNKWEWGFLRKICNNLELEQFYVSYMQRIRISYLSLFIFIEIIVSIIHCIILLSAVENPEDCYFDIGIYLGSSCLVWVFLAVNFKSDIIKRFSWIMYVSTFLTITLLVISDIGIPLYHMYTNHDVLITAYSSYVLYAIYIFMPLPENVHAFILGLAVTVAYMINYSFVTFRQHPFGPKNFDYTKLITEAIFMMGINLLGIYFRMMKEIAIRTTFLDRRQCVEENLLLRYARDQEKNLLLSIIPAQIANKMENDVRSRIEHIKAQTNIRSSLSENVSLLRSEGRWRRRNDQKLFIESHNDVTILYADVVNYTYLTTTLDVKTLVETIHDLFVKFDVASEEFNVLRIKFLGDCYYCVSGVPIHNDFHAKCCVDLGLRMIKDVRDVRIKRKLDIDMRIGVHSGNILSGVIGACKWQYDIWSTDVDIANRLEATGEAGRVHVSEQTLRLLDGEYMYEEGTNKARADEVLKKYDIRSFLIKTPRYSSVDTPMTRFKGVKRQIDKSLIKIQSSTNFMQNTILQYNQIRQQAKLEMNRELDKMPIGRIQLTKACFGRANRLTQDELEEQTFRRNITSLCLFFKDWRWEFEYMNERDLMLKYSVFCATIVFIAIVGIQCLTTRRHTAWWCVVAIESLVFLFFMFITWYKKIWTIRNPEPDWKRPSNKYSLFFFNMSDLVQRNIICRVSIYLLVILMYIGVIIMQMTGCNKLCVENSKIYSELFEEEDEIVFCYSPWANTDCFILLICMSFIFTRIPFMLKIFINSLLCVIYAILVIFEFDFVYEQSLSTNVGLNPEYSHIIVLLLTLVIFHIMDRQTEFISKVDYNWKRQLDKKQEDAKFTNETIKILINNILPAHVADIYMTKKMKNELYYEEYDNVAVLFATIKNYDTEKVGMRVLNEIICDFDEVVTSHQGPLKIEKIKVAGWTYMAACGLDVAQSEPSFSRNSSILPNGRRSQHLQSFDTSIAIDAEPSTSAQARSRYEGHAIESNQNRKISRPQSANVVFVMASFALKLMRTMHSFNRENLQYEDGDNDHGTLRIGISNGPIMAGVVGSYKPHYDIWGNAVNMASRMDSTGIPGYIQVTEQTAAILEANNIRCKYRGMTYVKGRGEIPTYFISINSKLQFVKIHSEMEQGPSNGAL